MREALEKIEKIDVDLYRKRAPPWPLFEFRDFGRIMAI
jgi:hypothetical protein